MRNLKHARRLAALCLVLTAASSAWADDVPVSLMAIDLGARTPLAFVQQGADLSFDSSAFALATSSDADCHDAAVSRRARARTVHISSYHGVSYDHPLDVPCPAGLVFNIAHSLPREDNDTAQAVSQNLYDFLSRLSNFVNEAPSCAAGGVISFNANAGGGEAVMDTESDGLRRAIQALGASRARVFQGGVRQARGRVTVSGGDILRSLGVSSVSCAVSDTAPSCTVQIPNSQKQACLAAGRGGGQGATSEASDSVSPKLTGQTGGASNRVVAPEQGTGRMRPAR